MRQISFEASDKVYAGLADQAVAEGITVGELMERFAVRQSRIKLDRDDLRLIRMHRAGNSNIVIAARIGITVAAVRRRMDRLLLVPNQWHDLDRDLA